MPAPAEAGGREPRGAAPPGAAEGRQAEAFPARVTPPELRGALPPSGPVPGGGAVRAPLRAGRGRAPGSQEGRVAAPRLAGQARTRGCAVGAAFSPLQSLQLSCGAGPGLGLDRTVPGTMVSTGPYGTPAHRSALPSALRPPRDSARPDGARLTRARRRPLWLRRGNGRPRHRGCAASPIGAAPAEPCGGPARFGSSPPPPSPAAPRGSSLGRGRHGAGSRPGLGRVAASGSRGRAAAGGGRLTGRPRPAAGSCPESCGRGGRLSRGGARTARVFGWGSRGEMAERLLCGSDWQWVVVAAYAENVSLVDTISLSLLKTWSHGQKSLCKG